MGKYEPLEKFLKVVALAAGASAFSEIEGSLVSSLPPECSQISGLVEQ